MVKKGISSEPTPIPGPEDEPQNGLDRTSKIMNTITNISIILMSTLMGGLAGAMMETMGEVASEMTGAMAGEEAKAQVKEDIKQKVPEAEEKMKELIAEVRQDVYSQMREKRKDIEPYVADEVFDRGPEIVSRYDLSLPRLSEELDDASLAQYSQLLLAEDPNFTQMFKELTDWLSSLPQSPEKDEGH